MADLLPVYKAKHLAKINSMRQTNSQPDMAKRPPVLTKGQVNFASAESRNNEPNSCYNCVFFNEARSRCAIMSPAIVIRKFVAERFKRIEYWPVCGYHVYGEAGSGNASGMVDPDDAGLIWINAPRVGQPCGGANCGGASGGDDCDYWNPNGVDDKRDAKRGLCRVLQTETASGDCCAAWTDDDLLSWQKAQAELRKRR